MKRSTRLMSSIIGILMCYVFLFFSLVFIAKDLEKVTIHILAIISGVLIGLFIWFITKDVSRNFAGKIFITAFAIGAIGFIIGFIGPLIVTPEANLGPLLGFFATGPLSFVFGLIIGGLYWKIKDRNHSNLPESS